jgi:hypothetical protein
VLHSIHISMDNVVWHLELRGPGAHVKGDSHYREHSRPGIPGTGSARKGRLTLAEAFAVWEPGKRERTERETHIDGSLRGLGTRKPGAH